MDMFFHSAKKYAYHSRHTGEILYYYCRHCNSVQRRKSAAIHVSLRKSKDSGA